MIRGSLLLAALAGCASDSLVTSNQSNYITFEHAFTEQAAADVRRKADSMCAARKQLAVRTTITCTLSKCVATYACMDQDEAAAFRSAPQPPQR